MQDFTFEPQGKITRAVFCLRQEHTLALTLYQGRKKQTLVYHDSIRKDGKTYDLFNRKGEFIVEGNSVTLRAVTMERESGAPIAGLLVNYRFTFDPECAAFYLSADFGSDDRLCGCQVALMDVTWEDMKVDGYTGYEYDAAGMPISHRFEMPAEKNPRALSYEELRTTRLHVALERTVTRPRTFRKAVAVHGKQDYLAVIGGTPTLQVEAELIRPFFEMETKMGGDLRFFSGENSPGLWFLLEKPEDLFALSDKLSARTPRVKERVLMGQILRKIPVTAGALNSVLLQTRDGVWLRPFGCDGGSGGQPMPLLYATLWDTKYERELTVDSGRGWDRVDILTKGNYLRVTLSDPELGEAAGITLVAEGYIDAALHQIGWKTRVVNRSDRFAVSRLSYPQCVVRGYDHAYVSQYSGMLYPGFNRRCSTIQGKYPTGNRFNMAYLALYNPIPMEQRGELNGFYLGIHDATGSPKMMSLAGTNGSDSTLLYSDTIPPYPRRAGNSFTLPGRMVWQSFSGDWFDATEIYRDFVHSCAAWLVPLRGREDSPAWLRDCPMWIIHFLPNENPDANPLPITLKGKPDKTPRDWYETALRLKEALGVPMAYHLYNWHWVPFNNDNPNYFPVHHDLKEGLQALKSADIRVVPYVQSCFWDMRDHRGEDHRFSEVALPATAKKQSGEPLYYTYASTEPDGTPARLSVMCPTTTVWKNEVRRICRRLYTEYGMDGIYLDVLSLNYDQCYAEDHLHAPGWGDYWWKAYAELIAGLRADAPEEFGIISECVAEVYSGAVDGMLSWTWVQVDSVPSFPRVYGGRTALVGRLFTSDKDEDTDYFRFQISQSLVYGQQLGWLHPDVVDDPKRLPFLQKMAALRYKYRELFAEGEMLRPPYLSGDVPHLDCLPYLRGQQLNHENLIQCGAWEDQSGHRTLFVINASDRAAEITLSVYEDEYRLPETLTGMEGEGAELLGTERENGVCKLHLRLAAEGYGTLNW